MTISVIAAVAANNVIGRNNRLIWRLPDDMKFFKEKTTGHVVITGRKNYESIPEKFRPLPGRTNIVVTRQKNYSAPGAMVVHSIEDALEAAKNLGETEVFIIGGADIYGQTVKKADRLYITHVHHSFEGDALFPVLEKGNWKTEWKEDHPADEKHLYPFTICMYQPSQPRPGGEGKTSNTYSV